MTDDVFTKLNDAEKYFKRSCEQIVQLNRRLDEMAGRYEKASKENRRSYRYTLRLRMAITEGVRNMYYEYASRKADEITELRCRILEDTNSEGSSGGSSDHEESQDTDDMEDEHPEDNTENEESMDDEDISDSPGDYCGT